VEALLPLLRAAIDRGAGHSADNDIHYIVVLEIVRVSRDRRRSQPPDREIGEAKELAGRSEIDIGHGEPRYVKFSLCDFPA